MKGLPMWLLILAWPAAFIAAQEPSCANGRTSTASLGTTWVEPHPPEEVTRQVVKSITRLDYRFVNKEGPFITAPNFAWPSSAVFNMWRGLVYPGAALTIVVQPEGPWTRLTLTTRMICETGQHPPTGHPQDVDFQTFVLNQTHSEAWDAIVGPLQRRKVRVFAESCAPLNDGDQKIDVCRRMAKAQPKNAAALLQYVLALAAFYHARDAWQPLRDLFALEGERPQTYDVVGAAMLEANQVDDASRLYERATKLWPGDPLMAYRLGRARLGLHQLEPAFDAFATATTIDSSFADAHTYAAVALGQLGRFDEVRGHCRIATRELAKSLPDRVDDVDAWLGLAYCASVFAHHQDAVSYFARALAVSDSRARATPELIDLIRTSFTLVGDQPAAPLPHRP